jgi:hypothetical protein
MEEATIWRGKCKDSDDAGCGNKKGNNGICDAISGLHSIHCKDREESRKRDEEEDAAISSQSCQMKNS